MPALEFRGTPAGIDVTLVARTGILPQIDTGMAGKVAGTGQVGAGLLTPPPDVFLAALHALAQAVQGPARSCLDIALFWVHDTMLRGTMRATSSRPSARSAGDFRSPDEPA